MANTYSQIYLQVVFAVYGRANMIKPQWRESLYKNIAGIVRNKGQKLISIGGTEDHIHMLIGIEPDKPVSRLVQEVKANSSRWVNTNGLVRGKFEWQHGFGVFSYSRSQIPRVARYIENQERHHSEQTFREEYVELLNRFEVAYDDRYLFEDV